MELDLISIAVMASKDLMRQPEQQKELNDRIDAAVKEVREKFYIELTGKVMQAMLKDITKDHNSTTLEETELQENA